MEKIILLPDILKKSLVQATLTAGWALKPMSALRIGAKVDLHLGSLTLTGEVISNPFYTVIKLGDADYRPINDDLAELPNTTDELNELTEKYSDQKDLTILQMVNVEIGENILRTPIGAISNIRYRWIDIKEDQCKEDRCIDQFENLLFLNNHQEDLLKAQLSFLSQKIDNFTIFQVIECDPTSPECYLLGVKDNIRLLTDIQRALNAVIAELNHLNGCVSEEMFDTIKKDFETKIETILRKIQA